MPDSDSDFEYESEAGKKVLKSVKAYNATLNKAFPPMDTTERKLEKNPSKNGIFRGNEINVADTANKMAADKSSEDAITLAKEPARKDEDSLARRKAANDAGNMASKIEANNGGQMYEWNFEPPHGEMEASNSSAVAGAEFASEAVVFGVASLPQTGANAEDEVVVVGKENKGRVTRTNSGRAFELNSGSQIIRKSPEGDEVPKKPRPSIPRRRHVVRPSLWRITIQTVFFLACIALLMYFAVHFMEGYFHEEQ